LKNSMHIPSRPGAFLPAPFFTAGPISSIEIGESSKSLQTVGTVLCPVFPFWLCSPGLLIRHYIYVAGSLRRCAVCLLWSSVSPRSCPERW
jgi:hypothetical protein